MNVYAKSRCVSLHINSISIRYKPEVETVPKTGSTNKLATGTDIDAIRDF